MNLLTSNSLRMMEKSMDFLWAKQTALTDNIANAETPGYRTKTVTFEEAFERRLRDAVRKGGASRADLRQAIEQSSWQIDEDDEVTRMDGNGVNVTEQMLEGVRTAYQLQYVFRAIRSDLAALNTAITG